MPIFEAPTQGGLTSIARGVERESVNLCQVPIASDVEGPCSASIPFFECDTAMVDNPVEHVVFNHPQGTNSTFPQQNLFIGDQTPTANVQTSDSGLFPVVLSQFSPWKQAEPIEQASIGFNQATCFEMTPQVQFSQNQGSHTVQDGQAPFNLVHTSASVQPPVAPVSFPQYFFATQRSPTFSQCESFTQQNAFCLQPVAYDTQNAVLQPTHGIDQVIACPGIEHESMIVDDVKFHPNYM